MHWYGSFLQHVLLSTLLTCLREIQLLYFSTWTSTIVMYNVWEIIKWVVCHYWVMSQCVCASFVHFTYIVTFIFLALVNISFTLLYYCHFALCHIFCMFGTFDKVDFDLTFKLDTGSPDLKPSVSIPKNPILHWHWKFPIPSLHRPPFWQGAESHSSMSTSHLAPEREEQQRLHEVLVTYNTSVTKTVSLQWEATGQSTGCPEEHVEHRSMNKF